MVRAIILSEKDNTATLFGNAEAGADTRTAAAALHVEHRRIHEEH